MPGVLCLKFRREASDPNSRERRWARQQTWGSEFQKTVTLIGLWTRCRPRRTAVGAEMMGPHLVVQRAFAGVQPQGYSTPRHVARVDGRLQHSLLDFLKGPSVGNAARRDRCPHCACRFG